MWQAGAMPRADTILPHVALHARLDRGRAEQVAHDAIDRRRRAAALRMAERDRARVPRRLLPDLLRQPGADAAQARVAERVDLLLDGDLAAARRQRALGDDDDGVARTAGDRSCRARAARRGA